MSEIILDTITGKSTATTVTIGSTPVVSASANSMTIRGEGSNQTSIQQGLAKSWVLGSDAAALTDSFNTASGTDNGVGDYTYTFTTAMSSANFTSHVTGMQNARRYGFSEARTTTTNRIDFRDDNETSADCANSCAIHGDLS